MSRGLTGRPAWHEIADRVFVRRYPVLDVNTTLVLGDEAALVVDTLSTPSQARELVDDIRRITPHPWLVVNTHHHFDHTYGNQVFAEQPGCAIWAHSAAADRIRAMTERTLGEIHDAYADSEPELAAEVLDVEITAPNCTVADAATLSLSGRKVELRYLGPGHTAGDLVVCVPDADVVIAGDLIEEGGPPTFEDAFPLEWPHTVERLLQLVTGPVVPGHGAVVDRDFVAAQHEELSRLAWLIRESHADGADPRKVASQAPFGRATALVAVTRGYAELAGRL